MLTEQTVRSLVTCYCAYVESVNANDTPRMMSWAKCLMEVATRPLRSLRTAADKEGNVINHQSDYGYTVGGLEPRNARVCVERARQCRRLAREYPQLRNEFRRFVWDWLREGKWYRDHSHE